MIRAPTPRAAIAIIAVALGIGALCLLGVLHYNPQPNTDAVLRAQLDDLEADARQATLWTSFFRGRCLGTVRPSPCVTYRNDAMVVQIVRRDGFFLSSIGSQERLYPYGLPSPGQTVMVGRWIPC